MAAKHRDIRPALRAARRFAHGFASWAYGIAIGVVLVGLWGRATAVDRPVVEEAGAEAVQAVVVSERVVGWIVEEAAAQVGRLPQDVEPAVRAVLNDPAARAALGDVIRVLVRAALSDGGEAVVVDLRAALLPHVPDLDDAFESFDVDPETVVEVVSALEPVVLDPDSVLPLADALAASEHALRLAAVIGAMVAAVLFAATLVLAEDRRRSARALAARSFFAAAGFAVMLRVGAWALDPGSGGADAAPSLRRALSILAADNLHIPLLAAVVAAIVWAGLRRRRPGGVTGEVPVVPSPG